MRRTSSLFGALILAVGVMSCGGGGGDGGITNPPPPPPPPPPTCALNTFCMGTGSFYTAAGTSTHSMTVSAGTTVTWDNSSGIEHNVLWDDATGRAAAKAGDGTGDMPSFATGTTHSRLFSTAGTYAFHCSIHFGMNGTLVVN
jgi:hypothetical protein